MSKEWNLDNLFKKLDLNNMSDTFQDMIKEMATIKDEAKDVAKDIKKELTEMVSDFKTELTELFTETEKPYVKGQATSESIIKAKEILDDMKKPDTSPLESQYNEYKNSDIKVGHTNFVPYTEEKKQFIDDVVNLVKENKTVEKIINKPAYPYLTDEHGKKKIIVNNKKVDEVKPKLYSKRSSFYGTVYVDITDPELYLKENPDEVLYIKNSDGAFEVYNNKATGYHTVPITKGVYGQISKIREELEELEDAERQGNKIMQLNELSDLIGSINGYAQTLGVKLSDLILMAQATDRAFKNGDRK